MRYISKNIKKIALASLSIAGGMYLATKLFPRVKKQSLSSWTIEKGLFVYGMKEEQRSLFEHQERIDDFIKWNTKKLTKPDWLVGYKVNESYYGPMQVFEWNHKAERQPIVFYLHGGGYAFPPYFTHYFFLRTITRKTNARIVLPIYLKTPKYSYQESIPHVISLYKEVLKDKQSDEPIILMGDSSGGGMALGIADAIRSEGLEQPAEIVLISPWLDLSNKNPEMADFEPSDPMVSRIGLNLASEYWVGESGSIEDPLVNPININSEGIGRISLFVGTHEVFYPDIIQFSNRLEAENVEHRLYIAEKMNHIYPIYPTPEAQEARQIISNIINDVFKELSEVRENQ